MKRLTPVRYEQNNADPEEELRWLRASNEALRAEVARLRALEPVMVAARAALKAAGR